MGPWGSHSDEDHNAPRQLSEAWVWGVEGSQVAPSLERLPKQILATLVNELEVAGVEHGGIAEQLKAAADNHRRTADLFLECARLISDQRVGQGRAGVLGIEGGPSAATRPRSRGARRLVRWLRLVVPARTADRGELLPPASSGNVTDPDPTGTSSATPERDALLSVRVDMLGSLEVEAAGQVLARWTSQKGRALFEYLTLAGRRPVRREVLMELLWPASSPTSARNNLNVCLHGLRSTLKASFDGPAQPERWVIHRNGYYELNRELDWRFDRDEFLDELDIGRTELRSGRPLRAVPPLDRASRLYRGPLFEDDPVQDWFLNDQRHLQDKYLEGLDDLAAAQLQVGDVDGARAAGQRALACDPSRESAHRVLMTCFARAGQADLVMRQFHRCEEVLRNELQVSPTDATLQLLRQLTAS